MPFEYQPLPEEEIRLITLQPIGENGDSSVPVYCTIEHVKLEDSEPGQKRPFKGNDRVWPETNYPVNKQALFKDPPVGSKSIYYNMLYTTSPRIEAGQSNETDSAHNDYATEELGLPWRREWGDYIALSYTWGDATPARQIFLNSVSFDVGPNLYQALCHLRCMDRIRQGFKIWVDAICLNQSDYAEKGVHIPRMRQIYASAWQTFTWIGVAENDSDLAITALRYLSDRSTLADPLDGFHEERKPKNNVPMTEMWTTYKSPFHKGVHKAIYHLLTRPYWHRMWIIQEVAMAREDSPIACGSAHISWKQLSNAASFIEMDEDRLGRYIFESVNPKMIPTWTYDFARSRCIEDRELSPERLWSLLLEMALVQRDQKRESVTNPHDRLRPLLLGRLASVTQEKDRVYGILGINAVADTINITPNYDLSLAEIYQDFSANLIARGDLNLLRLVSRPAGEIEGSWRSEDIPQKLNKAWLAPFVGPVLQKTSRYAVAEECTHDLPTWAICWTCKPAPVVNLPGPHRTYGTLPLIPPTVLPDTGLVVKVLLFDTVISLGAYNGSELDKSFPKCSLEPSENAYGSFDGIRSAFWQTIVAGTTKTGGNVKEAYSWLLEPKIWHQGVAGVQTNGFGLHDVMSRNQAVNLCGYTLQHIIRGADASKWARKSQQKVYDSTKEQREALSWAMNVLAWRRLTGTEAGRIGLSPAAAMLDDKIAIIQGCNVPLVLRPHKSRNCWTVVGECYVHGVMDGQLVNDGSELAELTLY